MGTIKAGEGVQFPCPFCGKSVIATEDPPQVFHAYPLCQKFKGMTIEEYIAAVSRMQTAN